MNETRNLQEAVSRLTREEVFGIARKALADLAGTSLEERMVDVFVRRLHESSEEEIERLSKALQATSSPVTVCTTFELTPAQCARTEGAIKEVLGKDTQIRFETTPDLVSGIELGANGHKVGWSIAEYLKALEQGVADLMTEKATSATKAEPPQERSQPEQVSQ